MHSLLNLEFIPGEGTGSDVFNAGSSSRAEGETGSRMEEQILTGASLYPDPLLDEKEIWFFY